MLTVWYHRLKIPFLMLIILLYFGFHGYNGNRGYLTRIQLESEIVHLQNQFESTQTEKKAWQKRIQLMQLNKIDEDYLEERAKHLTAKIKPGEKILLIKSN